MSTRYLSRAGALTAIAALTLSAAALPAHADDDGFLGSETASPSSITALDTRSALAPTTAQRDAVAGLGDVSLSWNSFGTPASILPASGSLGAISGSAVSGARAWLRANADLFGLSTSAIDGLTLAGDQIPAQFDGATNSGAGLHAVIFQQRFGDLDPAQGGLVTVGISGGQVRYVSSSLSRAGGAPVAAALTPVEAWREAAKDVGLKTPDLGTITTGSATGPFTSLTATGLDDTQYVRLAALPVGDEVRPVFQSVVLDSAASLGWSVSIDAVTGKTLLRTSLVDSLAEGLGGGLPTGVRTANATPIPAATGQIGSSGCGPDHTFAISDTTTKTVSMIVTAAPTDDLVVKLFSPGNTLLGSYDLATSPEAGVYSSATALPQGTYTVRVCEYEDGAAVVGAYSLTVATSDAGTGSSATANGAPKWKYFTAMPSSSSLAVGTTAANQRVGCWTAASGCDLTLNQFSMTPWDQVLNSGVGVPSLTTIGNNANTHEAWASALTPGGLVQAPVSATREYTTDFTDAWNESGCDPTNFVPGGNDIDAVVGNLFVAHNRMHDWSYYLGFTESNFNLQTDNRGLGGTGGDAEIGNAQAGAADTQVFDATGVATGRNNANQITLYDGTPGITNQYLFAPAAGAFYPPCTDGDLDMSIVGHEYTHAISNRMIGGAMDGITSEQGGAMGESWGDLDAMEYIFAHGYEYGDSPYVVGAYATGNSAKGIRDYAIDDNPLNYSDYGFDGTGNEVHADGEIWNGTQWRVRQALVEKWNATYPYANSSLQLACAEATAGATPRDPSTCPGNRRWIQLIFDAFLLQQGATDMLQARDAMIAADTMRFGGQDVTALWHAFALSGMGRDAASAQGTCGDVDCTADDGEPKPSFASPTESNATITFDAPAGGNVYVGDYEARVTPIADTVATTALGNAAEFVPGTYTFRYASAGGAVQTLTTTIPAGTTSATVTFPGLTNLAASASGASVIGATTGSLNAASLIDGTEATNWGVTTTDVQVDESHPFVAVDLAGGSSVIDKVQVSAYLRPSDSDPSDPLSSLPAADQDTDTTAGSRFTALRKFAIETCVSDCAGSGAWTRIYTSADDAFPGKTPRPVAPDLRMRTFDVPDTTAAAVRLVALENQCTGNDAYAGELDNDPTTTTDCKTGSDRGTIVHASELQVLGRSTAAPGIVVTGSNVSCVGDKTAPTAVFAKVAKRIKRGHRLTLTGRAADVGCGVQKVQLSVKKYVGTSCQYLKPNGRWTKRKPLRKCGYSPQFLLTATGTTSWRYTTAKKLPRGRYRVTVRAVDRAGNVPRKKWKVITVRVR
ncbi:MAG: M36 family metallopeptidase [Nocardioides sp.]|uniref:M36 family metallopeptidase n=1 Tax=Nocardioides sp. TaxID=35761 RepID=UPI0039E6F3AA